MGTSIYCLRGTLMKPGTNIINQSFIWVKNQFLRTKTTTAPKAIKAFGGGL
jgi:hypothetical protein